MKRTAWLSLFLLVTGAAPLVAQVDTVNGYVGDTARVPVNVLEGCYRVAVLSTTGAFLERNMVCGTAKPPVMTPPPVTPPPVVTPPPTTALAFSSTWPQVGTTDAILHDGGKWNGTLCNWQPNGQVAAVVSFAGVPGTSNTFQWKYAGSGRGECYMIQQSGRFAAPTVGQSAFYRYYYSNTVTDPAQAHWLQATTIAWEWKSTPISAGQYGLRFIVSGLAAYADSTNLYVSRALTSGTTYCVEFRLTRISGSLARVAFRVTDPAGALVASSSTVRDGAGKPMPTGGSVVPMTDADYHTFDMGNNDARPAGAGVMQIGAFAVRVSADTSAWIGR